MSVVTVLIIPSLSSLRSTHLLYLQVYNYSYLTTKILSDRVFFLMTHNQGTLLGLNPHLIDDYYA